MSRVTQEEAVRILRQGSERVRGLSARLSEEDRARPGSLGEGGWSVDDLTGHLAAWERLALQALVDWRNRRTPYVERIFAERGVDAFNERKVWEWRSVPRREAESQARAAHEALVGAIGGIDDEEWGEETYYPTERPRTLGELLGSVVGARGKPFGHADDHVADLEAYIREKEAAS
ncbi:MAG: maleylpyruvate isomerase N-terminal domain-containing protein [Actinobacteria bacterium]|nr:maleylpyruvate isomerase N-terminal domain-containing protein [Actinomycetota bacterium]